MQEFSLMSSPSTLTFLKAAAFNVFLYPVLDNKLTSNTEKKSKPGKKHFYCSIQSLREKYIQSMW